MDPDFIIVGEMKSGTTSLFSYLCEHPLVIEPFKKEPFFFDRRFHHGWNWYGSMFPSRLRAAVVARRSGRRPITGEATAYYFFHPLARHRIRAAFPDVKLIVLLRDPVERALSHYHHSRSKGREPLSFDEALDAEQGRVAGEMKRIVTEAPFYESFAHIHFTYAGRGHYAEQLEAWYEVFPREQILVLNAEDLFRDPDGIVTAAQEFLGLPVRHGGDYQAMNTRDYEGIAPETRRRLEELFDEPNRRLYDLIGRDLGWSRPRVADRGP